MSVVFRILLLFVIFYLGARFLRGIVMSIINSGKKKDIEINNNKENANPQFQGGEYIDYEEVKESSTGSPGQQ